MEIFLIAQVADWSTLESVWRLLAAAQENVTPFTSWEWMRCWWQVYSSDRMSLCILACREGDEVVGLVPLAISRGARWPLRPASLRVCRLLGTGEAEADSAESEYGDMLAKPGYEAAVARQCAAWLCGPGARRWDALAFENVLEDSLVNRHLVPALADHGRPLARHAMGLRYCATLPGSWDHYLKGLGKNTRAKLMAGRRRMERDGLCEIEVISDSDAMPQALERLAALHQMRWEAKGQAGAFSSTRFREFHRRLAADLCARGGASITFLRLDGRDLAGIYTLHEGSTACFYQTGFDPSLAANYSPGSVVIGIDIERAIAAGRGQYDFMRSEPGSHKVHYGCATTPMFNTYVFNHTATGRLAHALWRMRGLLQASRRVTAS